jgi:hypothetical protein
MPAPSPSRPASGVVSPPNGRQNAAARGSLLIRSTPPNAEVLINGVARGRTPLAVRDLPLGSYTIRLTRDGYVDEEKAVRLSPSEPIGSMTTTMRVSPVAATNPSKDAGEIVVQSRPAGAQVYVNDRPMGVTPLSLPSAPVGPATVRLELEGYLSWTATVTVNAGEQTKVSGSLEPK